MEGETMAKNAYAKQHTAQTSLFVEGFDEQSLL